MSGQKLKFSCFNCSFVATGKEKKIYNCFQQLIHIRNLIGRQNKLPIPVAHISQNAKTVQRTWHPICRIHLCQSVSCTHTHVTHTSARSLKLRHSTTLHIARDARIFTYFICSSPPTQTHLNKLSGAELSTHHSWECFLFIKLSSCSAPAIVVYPSLPATRQNHSNEWKNLIDFSGIFLLRIQTRRVRSLRRRECGRLQLTAFGTISLWTYSIMITIIIYYYYISCSLQAAHCTMYV